jgi:hypothetical protein
LISPVKSRVVVGRGVGVGVLDGGSLGVEVGERVGDGCDVIVGVGCTVGGTGIAGVALLQAKNMSETRASRNCLIIKKIVKCWTIQMFSGIIFWGS